MPCIDNFILFSTQTEITVAFFGSLRYNNKDAENTETYRSGHNENDSKSFDW